MDREKFAIDQIEKAQQDFTSLGRWGWALTITFLTQILLRSADSGGSLFPNIRCDKGQELGWPFLGVILLGVAIYAYFVLRAGDRIQRAVSHATSVVGGAPGSSLSYVLDGVPRGLSMAMTTALRLAIVIPLIGTWFVLFDVGTSRVDVADAFRQQAADPKQKGLNDDDAFNHSCKDWRTHKQTG
jgi:hypothetical protein